MKKFSVTATAPASAEVIVSGMHKLDAIDKVRAMFDIGNGLDFKINIQDSDDVEFTAKQIRNTPAPPKEDVSPDLNEYTVVLETTAYKEVPVKAISPDAALDLVHEMYFTTDALDFNDDDVTGVKATVKNNAAVD